MQYFLHDSELTLLGSNHYVEAEDGKQLEENLIKTNSDYVEIEGFSQLIKNKCNFNSDLKEILHLDLKIKKDILKISYYGIR